MVIHRYSKFSHVSYVQNNSNKWLGTWYWSLPVYIIIISDVSYNIFFSLSYFTQGQLAVVNAYTDLLSQDHLGKWGGGGGEMGDEVWLPKLLVA